MINIYLESTFQLYPKKINGKKCTIIVLAWNFFKEIKKNNNNLKKDLKWNPKINFKSGILKTLKWYKDNLHLFK